MNAKMVGAAIVALFGVTGTAGAADLYALTPAQTAFTATGQASVSENGASYTCSITVNGMTKRTVGEITGVSFSGAPGCENVMPTDLPWKVRALSYSAIRITHASVMSAGLGRCGPNEIRGTLSQGIITINDNLTSPAGICAISVSLTTEPSLSVAGAPPPP